MPFLAHVLFATGLWLLGAAFALHPLTRPVPRTPADAAELARTLVYIACALLAARVVLNVVWT